MGSFGPRPRGFFADVLGFGLTGSDYLLVYHRKRGRYPPVPRFRPCPTAGSGGRKGDLSWSVVEITVDRALFPFGVARVVIFAVKRTRGVLKIALFETFQMFLQSIVEYHRAPPSDLPRQRRLHTLLPGLPVVDGGNAFRRHRIDRIMISVPEAACIQGMVKPRLKYTETHS